MNARAIGCGVVGAIAFVLVALLGVWRAGAPAECPGLLPYEAGTYAPIGTPMAEPVLEGVSGPLQRGSDVSFGLASWTVYLPPGTAPTSTAEPLPPRIVLDCRDGTYQAFQRPTQ